MCPDRGTVPGMSARGSASAAVIAGYLRISVDDTRRARQRDKGLTSGEALNAAIERQREDCLAALEDLGWTGEVDWYVDRDTSAYNENVTRTEFERLLSDLAAGSITHVIVYHPDRLARQHLDLERMLRIYRREAKTARFATSRGEIDPRDEFGAKQLRWEVDNANAQSAATSRRVARKHRENAERGIPVGGTRPFGWLEDKRTLHADESKLIREAAGRVLAGAPLSTVVTAWNAAGLRTPRGNDWRPKALGLVLTNPRICGYSARNKPGPDGKPVLTVVRKPDGEPVQGVWEPVLTADEWEALRTRLAPKSRRPGGNVTKYLLSGIARCGKCTQPLRGLPRARVRSEDTFVYVCQSPAQGGCGGVSRLGPPVDDLIREVVLERLEEAALADPVEPTPWDGEAELARVTRLIAEQTEAWHAELISTEKHFGDLPGLEARQRELRQERGRHLAESAALAAVPPADVRALWAGTWTLAEKRAAVLRVLSAVIIHPVPPGRSGSDPGLVEPVRRQSP